MIQPRPYQAFLLHSQRISVLKNLNLARNMTAYERPLTDIPFMRRAFFGMEKIIGIYKITSPTGRIYIGQSVNILDRWSHHKAYKGGRKSFLYHSFKSHGVDKHKFEILHRCEQVQLNQLEKYYVDLFQTFNTPHGMNHRDGGGNHGKISDAMKENLRQKNLGKRYSAETNKKKWTIRYGKDNHAYGKTATWAKVVIQLDSAGNAIAKFKSVQDAENNTGVLRSHIRMVCNGKYKTAKGLYFKFA